MAAFNLTAELNLRGPSNINQVVGNIRRQLSTLTLDLNINPNTSRGVQAVTANIRTLSTALRDAQSNAAALSSTLSNLVTTINNAGNAAANAGNAINRLNTQTRAAQNAARDGATAMENFGAQSALAIRRFAAFTVATGTVYAFARALSSAYSEFVNFNKEFVRLQQVTNTSASGLSDLSQEITRLSTSLGVSSSELLTVSSTLAQAGLSASQTKTALEALAKSALAPSFDSLNETVEGSIALMRQFGLSAGDLESALGSINAVAAKFAVESSDIITAIQRTGGVFASASKGVSQGKDALNEFIAVFTSVRATTRESAETIATGLRTIFTRIQRGNTIQALKEYGIRLTDLEDKFVGPYEAVRRLSEGLKNLDPRDLRFSSIVEELGGFRQIGKVIPLIQQFATAQQALSVAQRGSGSLAGDAAKAQESLAIRVNKVREEFIALIRDIGQTQSFQKFVDISLQLASALISVASAAKDVLPAITAIAAIRAVPAIAQFAGGFGRSFTRRNQGGPIQKFATGGLVPGSGNRDTVPAMLTPGEFVIRKKAVETIGATNLARMNVGGKVQKFGGGGGAKKGIDWKNLSMGRGRKGSKGARSRFDLPQPGDKDYLNWVRQIYAEYDADPSLPRVKVNGVPTPPEIAYADKLISQEVFERGGSGMMLGYDAKGNEVIGKFGRTKTKKSGSLKKTPLGLILSAAGETRGARAPAGEMEKRLAAYEKDPEYLRAIGKQGGTPSESLLNMLKGPLSSFRTSGGKTSLAGVFPGASAKNIKAAIPQYIASLGSDEPQKAAKANTALKYFDSFVSGATANKPGHATHFVETINQILKSGLVQEFADGGFIQKFAQPVPTYNSGKVRDKPGRAEREIKKGMGNYQFGLVGLYKGAKTEEGFGYKNTTQIDLGEKYNNAKATLNTATLSAQYGETFSNNLEKSLKSQFTSSVQEIATTLAAQLGSSTTKNQSKIQRAVEGSGFASVAGAALESAIALIGSPYLEKTEKTKSIDFPFGLGKASGLFGINPRIPTDVTRTIGGVGKSETQMKEQILRFLGAVEGGEFTKVAQEKVTSRNNRRFSGLLPSIMTRIKALGGGGRSLLTAAGIRVGSPKYFPTGPVKDANKLLKTLREAGDPAVKELEEILRVAEAKKKGEAVTSIFLSNPYNLERKAMGGGISGQDTVPALLTPGEFVINKKAASRIGSAKLNKLNKADKIQGFNKGGAVGSVQTFADGGFASPENFAIGAALIGAISIAVLRFRELSNMATTLSGSLRGFNRSVDMGLPRTGQGTRRGGANPRNFDNQEALINRRGLSGFGRNFDAVGIAFGGSALASSAGDTIGGKTGQAISEVGTAISGVVGIAASLGGLSNPIGLLVTGVVAATSAVTAWSKATREATIQEEQKKIESRSNILDKSFERITTGRTQRERDVSSSSFLNTLAQNIKSEEIIRQQEIVAASPIFNLGGTSETLANSFDYNKLGSRFGEINKDSSERILSFINQGLSKNQNLESILQQLEKAGISRETSKIAIGSASARASEISQAQAKVKAAEAADLRFATIANKRDKNGQLVVEESLRTTSEKTGLAQLLSAVFDDFNKFNEASKKVADATGVVTSKLNLFAEAVKNVQAAASRASAEFEETQRQIDIGVGSKLGGRATISLPSRANENVLQNLRAYSPEEIGNVINQFGQNANLNPEFTQRASGTARSLRILEVDLPRILSRLSDTERAGGLESSRSNELRDQLKEALDLGGVKGTEANKVIDSILEELVGLQGKGEVTINDLINSSEALAKLYNTDKEALQNMIEVMQSFNGTMGNIVSKANEYAQALEQSINTQLQANQIRTGGSLQLREALGDRVSLRERNSLFNNEILGMTATIGAGNRPIAGTGTTDPNEIANRLAAAEQRKRELEAQASTSGPQKFASELSQVTLQINQYENALKKLANDTNRASNALSEISRLRQLRETRQESFLDFASNINEPDYLSGLIQQVGSLTAVMSGQGGIADIGFAKEGFQRRAAAGFIEPGQLEKERTQFIQQVIGILERSSGRPLPQQLKDQIARDFGSLGEEKDAITEFNNAVEAQARATEISATRTREGADYLYNRVIAAADQWVTRTSQGSNMPVAPAAAAAPGAGGPVAAAARGGLIYASKGQLIDFQPKGTDTVPAMLTPGEFVVNAKATKNNLSLLKQINSGGKTSGFSRGGVVYLADGGQVDSNDNARKVLEEKIRELKNLQAMTGEYIDISGGRKFIARAGAGSNAEAEVRYKQYEQDINNTQNDLNSLPPRVVPQTPQAQQQQAQQQQAQQQSVPLTPKQKAKQEKERRQQAFLADKEAKKQAAMARNPGYAARVGREEAKKRQEQIDASQQFPDLDPKDAIKEYRKEKRARVQEMNRAYGNSVNIYTSSNKNKTDETKTEESVGPILSQAEVEAIERKTYGGLTKAEYDNQRKEEEQARQARLDEIQASRASTETLEARLLAFLFPPPESAIHTSQERPREEQRRNKAIADYKTQEKIDKEKRNKSIAKRQDRDAEARSRGFRDAAQEAGAQARQKAEAKIAAQRAADQEKRQTDEASIASGTNAGVAKAQRMQEIFATDVAYENQRKDFALTEYIKTRIQEKYLDDLTDKKDPARDRANLERLISDATADYNAKRRQVQEQFNNNNSYGPQNIKTAVQQFQEGIDQSPILAAGTAIPRSAYGVIRAGVGYTVAGAMALKNMNPANRPEDIAFNNEIINSAMAQGEAGLREIQATGAELGYKLGLDNLDLTMGTEAYTGRPAGVGRMTMMDPSDESISETAPSSQPLSRGLFDKQGSGDAQARAAIAAFVASGPRTAAYASAPIDAPTTPTPISPIKPKAPGEYQRTAEMARARIKEINEQEANKAKGLYTTDESTTLGQLSKPENVQRAVTIVSQIAAEGAVDAFGGASSLVVKGEAAVAKGLTQAANAANSGLERAGGKLVDIAEAGIESARTNSPLLPKLPQSPLPKIRERITEALESRRAARKNRIDQIAQTKEALDNAERGANLAEAARRRDVINAEMRARQRAAKVEATQQSDKSSGSVSTPLAEPKASGRVTLEAPETKPSVTRQDMETEALRIRMENALIDKEQELQEVVYKNYGGLIYASRGTLVPYQPRGTDTVPAMLTPGEFVVNKAATQRNLPLLKAINNNSQYLNKGGKVQYFADGTNGPVSNMSGGSGGVSSFRLDSSAFSDSVGIFNTSITELKTVLGNFGDGAGTLAKSATDLAAAFGGINTSASTLSAAATILQGAAQSLTSPITTFTSSIDRISSTLNNMKDINVNITGSIPPISIVVEVNGGDGLKDELKPFADEIYSKIGQRLAQATNGLFKIETTS